VLLNINYRSPEGILSPAVRLIDHNAERIPKSPTSGVVTPGTVSVLPSTSSDHHARCIIDIIQEETRQGRRLGDIAILCHNNSVLREMRDRLRRHRVPILADQDPSGDGVEVVTFHKAKGREWPVVILPNSEDRVMPRPEDVREGNVESIRRRYYVAMTRAAEHLVISYIRAGNADVIHRTAEDEVVGTNGASRFLFEAGLVAMPEPESAADQGETPPVLVPEPAPVITTGPGPVDRPAPDPAPPPAAAPSRPPASPPAEKPRRGKLQPWHLRAKEVSALERARNRWAMEDYGYALYTGWPPIEALLKRVMKVPRDDRQTSIKDVIDLAFNRDIIDFRWHAMLHNWRRLRNEMAHEIEDEAHWTPERIKTGHQMIERAADFVAYLEEQLAPKQVVLETHDDFVQRLSGLVEMIRFGKPYPKTGRPLKAIRFNPEREALEILAMQFAMVLQDVRFYIPDTRYPRSTGGPLHRS
jgi:hypothetical protein